MQSLTWYANRLGHMSARELAWRTHAFVRDRVDAPRIKLRMVPAAVYADGSAADIVATAICLSEHLPGCWVNGVPDAERLGWRGRLLRHADALVDHRFTFFSLEDRHLGDPIEWNRDHECGTAAPLWPAHAIDYRDPRVVGDAKVVWEPARHHQLVVLARAYRVTGDERYAQEVVRQIDSWLDQCPFGSGMHWRSPLELAIRAINWIWAFDLIRPSGMLRGVTASRFVNALHLHTWDIARKYSRGSSANNHRIGEAAGVFIVSTCFHGLKGARRWHAESRRILEEEIVAQTYPDGGSREQAFGYHLFVLQFLVLAAVAARRAGNDFSPAFHHRLERMFEFTAAMVEAGPATLYGDCDDGYVVELGNGRDPREWLAVAAGLFDRPDLACDNAGNGETAYWLLGSSATQRTPAERQPIERTLVAHAFPASGRYLLQCGTRGQHDALSVLFDCGELGFGSIAAHGHADALAFTLRAFGEDLLVDPGTYDYFRFPDWRDYFRSTRAHNTVAIDGLDQSVAVGPFMWGRRARSWCTKWQPRSGGGVIEGTHDGYTRLTDPVQHSRCLDLDGRTRVLTIVDRLAMSGQHTVSAYFHFAENCVVKMAGPAIEAVSPRGRVRLEPDRRLTAALLHGSNTPPGGWVSRAYHCKRPAMTVVLSGTFQGDTQLVTRILVGTPPWRAELSNGQR